MDIIMAYASGLLPDEAINYQIADAINAEASISMPGLTKAKFSRMAEMSIKLVSHDMFPGETMAIISAQKLCRQLLAIYEQENSQCAIK